MSIDCLRRLPRSRPYYLGYGFNTGRPFVTPYHPPNIFVQQAYLTEVQDIVFDWFRDDIVHSEQKSILLGLNTESIQVRKAEARVLEKLSHQRVQVETACQVLGCCTSIEHGQNSVFRSASSV